MVTMVTGIKGDRQRCIIQVLSLSCRGVAYIRISVLAQEHLSRTELTLCILHDFTVKSADLAIKCHPSLVSVL